MTKTATQLEREIATALKSVDAKKLFAWRPKLEETIIDVDEGRISRSKDQPLRVSKLDTPRGAYVILDGHHRAVEAIRAGQKMIPIEIDRYVPRIEHTGGAFDNYVNDKVNVYDRVLQGSHAEIATALRPWKWQRDGIDRYETWWLGEEEDPIASVHPVWGPTRGSGIGRPDHWEIVAGKKRARAATAAEGKKLALTLLKEGP